MTDATTLARHLVTQWIQWGVQHVVLCPGSRSAPLAFAAHEAAGRGDLILHTRIDERVAAFTALGMAKASGLPAVVFTTSGTAAANLHPAVLEASHAGVPLVAVTADRPAVLRGTGANQTTDQVRLFGGAAVFVDLHSVRSVAPPQGCPLHLNVQFAEPLIPSGDGGWLAERIEPTERELDPPVLLEPGARTVVVAGDGAGPEARTLAEKAGWPLLAEPSSGARAGANAIRTYRLLLAGELGDRIERVVLFGHPTLSRPVTGLLTEKDVVSVRMRGRWTARPFSVLVEHDAVDVLGSDRSPWLDDWRQADTELSLRLDKMVRGEELTPYAVAAAVHQALPPDGLLHVGASNPIRDLDLMARPTTVGERRLTLANRGLAGIDGVVATAIGEALARPSERAICYLGDVSFVHDMGALVLGPREQRPDLTVVVANDDGGSIFSVL